MLTDRAGGRHDTWHVASVKRQNLSEEQEETLKEWISQHASIDTPYTRQDAIVNASAISGKTLGLKWYRCSMKHHPRLCAAKLVGLDPKCAKNFNEAVIKDYFDKLEEFHSRFGGIPPEHIWNMDEKGIQMGGGRKKDGKKYLFLKGQQQKYQLRSDNLELVTVLKCISAAGEITPPSFCLQEGTMPNLCDLADDKWERCVPHYHLTISESIDYWSSLYFSESGWMDSTNCTLWFQNVFTPLAKACCVDPMKPIILAMDRHETHENTVLKRAAYNLQDTEVLQIEVFCFPSKTTHKCQPLNVLIFSAIKQRWQATCKEYQRQGIPMNRFTVIPAYIHGTCDILTKALIAWAFEKTGLYPVNRGVFGFEDFAPSQALSIIVNAPPSFLDESPPSDQYEPSSETDSNWHSSSDIDVEDDHSQSIADEALHAPDVLQPGAIPIEHHMHVPVQEQENPAIGGPRRWCRYRHRY
jgi:DDE superfamily endonuclease